VAHALLIGRDALRRRDNLSIKQALQIVLRTALVVGTLLSLYLLFLLRHLVLTLFLAIVFASALRPLAIRIQRQWHLSRGVAVLALYGVAIVGVVFGVALLVPSFAGSVTDLVSRSHDVYGRWYELAVSLRGDANQRLNITLPMPPPQPQADAWLAGVIAAAGRAAPGLVMRAATLLGQVLLGMLMAYYWIEARDDLLGFGARLFHGEQRARFLMAFDEVEQVLGAYMGGQIILSLIIAGASLLAFVALGLPHPEVLALISGLLHMLPLVGAVLGVVPAVVVAVAISPVKGLLTVLIVVVIHQVENSFVAPRVLEKQMGLSPLLTVVALTAGIILGGFVGALCALPLVGAVSILARHFLFRPVLAARAAQTEPTEVEPVTGDSEQAWE